MIVSKISTFLFFFVLTLSVHAQWSTTFGNSGTGLWLGTNDNTPLDIRTNSLNRMYILSNGRIGINTKQPVGFLHINGSLGANVRNFSVQCSVPGLTAFSNTEFSALAHVPGIGGNSFTGLYVKSGSNQGTAAAYFDGKVIVANGSVGVGVTAPFCKTHIDGDLFVTGTGKNGVLGTASLLLGDDNIQPQFGIEYNEGGLNFWKPFGSTDGSGGNGFGNHFLFIKDNGKVGIHTKNPTADFTVFGNMVIGDPAMVCIPNTNYRLFVQTGILTERIKVAINCTANWADHVFSKEYQLMSLKEVEKYILKNNHLPGVPSAAEVVQDGIDLAVMNAKLLEKIEEITIYLIEQQKEIEKSHEEIQKLKARIGNKN